MIGQYRAMWLVMRREVTERLRSRVFLISTALLIVLIAGGVVAAVKLPDLLEKGPQKVGLVGDSPDGLAEPLASAQKQTGIEIETVAFSDEASASEALRKNDIAALLKDSSAVMFNKEVDEKIELTLNQAVQLATLPQRLADVGVTAEQLQSIVRPEPLVTTFLDPQSSEQGGKPSEGEQVIAAIAFTLLLLATTIYGNIIFMGVVEEKGNRVVEVLLGTMRPIDLLVGKVAGILVIAMVQLLAGLGAAVAALIAVGSPPDMPDTTFAAFAVTAGAFLLGLVFFSLTYAAMGAMVSRPEQSSSNVPMGVFVGALTLISMSLLEQPNSPLLHILSIVPPTSAFLMPQRVAIGDPPLFEVIFAGLVMVAAIVALARACGRIYAGAILSSGQNIQLLTAWRASKEAVQQ